MLSRRAPHTVAASPPECSAWWALQRRCLRWVKCQKHCCLSLHCNFVHMFLNFNPGPLGINGLIPTSFSRMQCNLVNGWYRHSWRVTFIHRWSSWGGLCPLFRIQEVHLAVVLVSTVTVLKEKKKKAATIDKVHFLKASSYYCCLCDPSSSDTWCLQCSRRLWQINLWHYIEALTYWEKKKIQLQYMTSPLVWFLKHRSIHLHTSTNRNRNWNAPSGD